MDGVPTVTSERLVDDHFVQLITIDRSPVNSLDMATVDALQAAFASLDKGVRAVVLTGAGSRAFCAGADVKEIGNRTTELSLQRSERWRLLFETVRNCAVPVVAAVNAPAVGAGCVLAACADIVIAAETATFSLPEILVGVMGGTRHTARMAPAGFVRAMALTGDRISAEEMARFGGIRKVVPSEAVLKEATAIASTIATRSPSAVRLMKEAMNASEALPVELGYRVEQLFTTIAAAIPDARAAAADSSEPPTPNNNN